MVAPPRVRRESARRLSDCISALLDKQPFFGNLALRLPIVQDDTRKTLATDGEHVRFNAEWVAETPAHEVEGAIARIVFACALKHHTRRGERDRETWQQASQLVTHPMIRAAGFTLPAAAGPNAGMAALAPEWEFFDKMSVEDAYEWLQELPPQDGGDDGEQEEEQPEENGGDDAAAAGDDSGDDGDDESDGSQPGEDGDDGEGDGGESDGDEAGEGSGEGEDGDADGGGQGSGSGSGDDDGGEQETPSHDPSGTGEVMDAQDREPKPGEDETDVDLDEEEQAWDEAMHQSASIAKAEGKLPGHLQELVQSAHGSQLDWRALLRRFMEATAARDYTWSRPNRRFIDSGLYLPAMHSEAMGNIALILDTSGSVESEVLAEFWSEVREIAAELRPEQVIVLQVDTRVAAADEYTADDLPDELEAKGRGGTDFVPGFDWIEREDIQPACCLYFTDMECTSFPEEPAYPVLWCDYGGEYGFGARIEEPFGERIKLR